MSTEMALVITVVLNIVLLCAALFGPKILRKPILFSWYLNLFIAMVVITLQEFPGFR